MALSNALQSNAPVTFTFPLWINAGPATTEVVVDETLIVVVEELTIVVLTLTVVVLEEVTLTVVVEDDVATTVVVTPLTYS